MSTVAQQAKTSILCIAKSFSSQKIKTDDCFSSGSRSECLSRVVLSSSNVLEIVAFFLNLNSGGFVGWLVRLIAVEVEADLLRLNTYTVQLVLCLATPACSRVMVRFHYFKRKERKAISNDVDSDLFK
eukprot:2401147-Amphidinium_carterae.2